MAYINGRSYDWSMIKLSFSNISGAPLNGVKKIMYSKKRTVENNYGLGSQPTSKGFGNVEYEASITLDKNAVVQLNSLAPEGDFTNLTDFDLSIIYEHPDSGSRIADTLEGCTFTEQGVDVSQGDTVIDVDIPIVLGNIIFNDTTVAS